MIEKLTKNTKLNKDTQFNNTELNSEDQQALKNYVEHIPFGLSNMQMEYVKSDQDVDLYQNPLKNLILECRGLVNNVKDNVNIYITNYSTDPIDWNLWSNYFGVGDYLIDLI